MAFNKTILVAVALVAVFSQLSEAGCGCGRGQSSGQSSGGYGLYSKGAPQAAEYSSDSSEASSSYSAEEEQTGAVSAPDTDDSWTAIPSNAIHYSQSQAQPGADCGDVCEIRVSEEAPRPIGIVQAACACPQHLSYEIEVPAETCQRQHVPSYHSVNVHVPVRAPQSSSLAPLPYEVEVPRETPCQCRLQNLNVQIAVPVQQRVVDTRQHSSYTVEVPAAQPASTRLTNLRTRLDRIVMPSNCPCLPPNNGPAPAMQQVHYVAVPASPACVSPFSLLGLGSVAAAPAAPAAPAEVPDVSYSNDDDEDSYQPASSSSSNCRCPCDD